MSRIDDLIARLAPEGVEVRPVQTAAEMQAAVEAALPADAAVMAAAVADWTPSLGEGC